MAKKVDLQERLNMRFLTVAYADKQETYGTSCTSADTGSIALDILNIPDSVLEELVELTDPMMELVDFLNNNRNPNNKVLSMMLTASKNVFRVVDLLREVPPVAGQDFSWLDEKLPTFDLSRDAKYLTYLHHFIYDTFKFFRMQQECWTIDSLDTYKPTRRMAAIYNANCQDKKKSMKIFCQETGYTQKKAEEYLAEAIGIRGRQTEVIIDRDEDDTAVIEEIVPDGVGSLPHIIHSNRFGKAIRQFFEKLPWLDQTILKARNAICDNCGGMQPMKEQFSFREIAVLTGCGTEKGGKLAYQAALDCLIRQLTEDEVFRIMNLKQKTVTRRKKKIAAATYLYQADCDGEWGEIYIDFVNKKAKIIQLADWDLTRSWVYARTAIRFLISTGGRNLPKKRRVIFEPQRPPHRQHRRKLGAPNTDIAGFARSIFC